MVTEWPGRNSPDYLSSMPDLCLLNVFSNLSRNDLYNVRFVNRKMKQLSTDKSLDNIKWDSASVEITQTELGYGFYMKVYCVPGQSYPRRAVGIGWDASFSYEVCKADNGDYIEERRSNGPGLEWVVVDHPPHDWLMPDCLIDALATVTRHHAVERIIFRKIPYKAEFFEKLRVVLAGHSVTKVYCSGTDGQPISDATRLSFARLINNTRDIALGSISAHLASLINEEFIREIRKSPKTLALKCFADPREVQQFRFYPTIDILGHLMHFDNLEVPHMVLRTHWLPRLFMDWIDGNSTMSAWWRVSIDRPIDEDRFAETISDDFEYFHDEDYTVTHYLMRKTDRRYVDFQVFDYANYGQESILVMNVSCHMHPAF